MKSRVSIDLPTTKGMELTLEDKILVEIFNEKGCTIAELSKKIGQTYSNIRSALVRMSEKGYVVLRNEVPDNIYYLTVEGAGELQYRINQKEYLRLLDILLDQGFYYGNATRFLKNRLYNFYLKGEWNEDTLVDQYKLWCKLNELELYSSKTRKLVK